MIVKVKENGEELEMNFGYKKRRKGAYDIIDKDTGEKIGRVGYKSKKRVWSSSASYAGVVARWSPSRDDATRRAVKMHLIKKYRNNQN